MAYTKTEWDNGVTAVDETNMNKIEDGLFNQDARITVKEAEADGWIAAPGTWTYASANTINVPSGAASIYSVGDKIKLTQTNAKYFYVTAITSNLLTVTGGSDYTVESATITSPYYSHQLSPLGFPRKFNYTPTIYNTANAGTFTKTDFTIIGNFVFYRGQMNYANAYGSGSVLISIPLPFDYAASPLGNDYHNFGLATFYNSGVGVIKCYVTLSGGGIYFPAIGGSGGPDNTTWSTGDAIYWQCSYPIA